MADFIFTSGTCAKSDLYSTIINAFVSAGWTNVSSNPTVDFDVLQSPSEAGGRLLTIQLRATNATNVNSIVTTDNNAMAYRLVESYTPGTAGAAGTFGRPVSEAWNLIYVVPTATAVSMNTMLTYFISVNKNRMIIVIETPPATTLAPVIHYIGLPDTLYTAEAGSRGVLVATTFGARSATTVHVSNAPSELASEAVSSVRTVYCLLAPRNPNAAGLYSLSDMKYGSTAESYRGKLSGLYALPSGNVNNGDVITQGAKKYRVTVAAPGTTSFPTTVFAIQIE
ncbi:hypothetical protein D1872_37300 [compost metagenome]